MNGRVKAVSDGTTREHVLDTPDGSVRVRVLGAGPAVLCLHGASAQGRSWLPVAERYADRASFWMPDLLGRGASTPRPDLSFDLESETRRVQELLSVLAADSGTVDGSRPTVIAGHSQGAAIALSVARDDPAVRGLLLSNPVTPWTVRPAVLSLLESGLIRRFAAGMFSPLRRPLAAAILRRAAGPRYRVPGEIVAAYAAPYADRRRAENLMALLRDWRPSELDGRVPVDRRVARVVAGELDPRITPDSAERLARQLSAPFTLVPGGGHVLPEQFPDIVAGELGRILEALAAETGPGERT